MPTQAQLRIDNLLSNVSVKYKNQGYIAEWVFPYVNVKKNKDQYRVYSRNFRLPETLRSSKGVAREYMFDVSYSSYVLQHHAQKDYVSQDDADNYDMADLKADTTEVLTDVLLLRQEKMVADLFTTTSWSLNVSLAATAAWNANTTVSDPVPIWDTGASEVMANSGRVPNKGFMSRDALVACKAHISILDRLKYTNSEVTEAKLAGLFGVSDFKVPFAQIDSSEYGATDSIAAVFESNVAWLGYVESSPGPLKPSAGYVFQKPRPLVKTWIDKERDDATAVEVNKQFVPKVVASLCGFLIKDTV